jgi:hypothetical protein
MSLVSNSTMMERSRCRLLPSIARLPPILWKLVLDYAFDSELWVAREPLLDRPGPPSGFWLLFKSLNAGLHRWIWTSLIEGMKRNDRNVLRCPSLCRTPTNETSFYAQKRAILALGYAPRDFIFAVEGLEGNYFSTEVCASMEEQPDGGTIDWSAAVTAITQMTQLSFISGPFLRGLHGLQRIDLRSLQVLKEIGDDCLSLSSVEEVLVPVGIERIGNRFLTGSRIKALDLSLTRITEVGDEFLSCTPVSSIQFPSTLRRVGCSFMVFPTKDRLTSIDLSETVLEFVGDSFLVECFASEIFLPVTLKVVPNNFLGRCQCKSLKVMGSIEVVGENFLAKALQRRWWCLRPSAMEGDGFCTNTVGRN